MGKDLASKNLLNCTDVFADIGQGTDSTDTEKKRK